MAEIVEDQEAVREEEDGIGEPEVVSCHLRQVLEVTDDVVRQVADGSPLESRKPRNGHGVEAAEEIPERSQRVPLREALDARPRSSKRDP